MKHLSHHAYCLIGDSSLNAELTFSLEKDHHVSIKGNSDFIVKSYDILTIADARKLKESAGTRPVDVSGKKFFILSMNEITVEAQNALLKLLEEPPAYAHFFLIIPSEHLLLPTVKSRLFFLQKSGLDKLINDEKSSLKGESAELADKFLKSNASKRLEMIRILTDDISKEKKKKQFAVDLLNEIEKAVYYDEGVKKGRKKLEAVGFTRKYANDRAPSLKMLLEYAALAV